MILNHRICIAPMMKYTDSHFRYFMRLISKKVVLYTEMLSTGLILYKTENNVLKTNEIERPIAVQFGGNNPKELSECSRLAENAGFNEINLNVGCPSARVQQGSFGAVLMRDPQLVADCVCSMQEAISIPVSVKMRLGIDENFSYETLKQFVDLLAHAGCKIFIIHARLANLEKLNTKENRKIPPLKYEEVYRLKIDFPCLEIIINGGVDSITAITEHLKFVDGVMIGRAANANPYSFIEFDRLFFNDDHAVLSRNQVLEQYLNYAEEQLFQNNKMLHNVLKPIINLFQGVNGARKWRQFLTDKLSTEKDVSKIIYSIGRYKI